MLAPHVLKLATPELNTYFKRHYRDQRGSMEYGASTGGIEQAELDVFLRDYRVVRAELKRREIKRSTNGTNNAFAEKVEIKDA